jgi:TRAP-type uncharacterized transport system substrate-binding protein
MRRSNWSTWATAPVPTRMQNGQIAGMSTPAGTPTSAVTRAFAAMGNNVKMLEFTDEQIEQADGGLELWTRYVINEGTYPGQARDIATIAQPNFLGVRADVDEEAVYLITKTIYENLGVSQRHPQGNHGDGAGKGAGRAAHAAAPRRRQVLSGSGVDHPRTADAVTTDLYRLPSRLDGSRYHAFTRTSW